MYKDTLKNLINTINSLKESSKGVLTLREETTQTETSAGVEKILKVDITYESGLAIRRLVSSRFVLQTPNKKLCCEESAYLDVLKQFLKYILFLKKGSFINSMGNPIDIIPLGELLSEL